MILVYTVPVSVYCKIITRGRESGLANPLIMHLCSHLVFWEIPHPRLFAVGVSYAYGN